MKKLHILSNSHLDREHRHSFQETRIMMVEMMDDLIEIMENNAEYKYFTLDGQAVVLDDYLEVKPHMKERLSKLIRDGRILIGPWYSLVDCYSVNPESVVRNLLMGAKVCRRFGEPMKVGYSIFSFGQMAQLPQIYSGFGIHDIMFYKGASTKAFPQSEFLWIAPDGSRALATRLGKEKRWNFYFDFDIPVLLGGDAKKPGWEAKFTDGKRLCHLNDAQHKKMYACLLEPDIRIRKEKIKECIETIMSDLTESASDEVFAAFDGTDFTSPFKEIPEVIQTTNALFKDELELVSSNPEIYFNEFKKTVDTEGLKQYTGEMRFGPVSHVHSETMGTNTDIKQASFHAENTLLNYSEPLSVIAQANGGNYPSEIIELAWKYLFQAQAHDSIHGSGDPKIKTDNLNRLAQVQEIADSITKRAIEGIASLIDFSGFDKEDIALTVFNTTPYPRSEVIELTIDLPQEELTEDFWIEDLDGNRVESYKIGQEKFNLAMIHRRFRPQSVYSDRFTLNVYVTGVPAMGFKTYRVKRIKGSTGTSTNPFPIGISPYRPIGICGNVLDNGLIRVTIAANGSIDVYDYDTKRTYHELNVFRDIGSCGDFWIHREPLKNSIISSKGSAARIELIANSGLLATYRVTITLEIPEGLEGQTRSDKKLPTEITTEITVQKNSKRIDFKTSLTNRSKDHMLVVDFPTGMQTKSADWEAPFEIREREVDPFTNRNGIKGDELERQAMQNFVNISDEKSAFALFSKGIKEVGTKNEDGAVISLTLFRAASGTFPIHNDLLISFENETSQCLGNFVFEYAVLFHNNEDLIAESRKYIAPMAAAEMGVSEGGIITSEYSFMKYTHKDLCLSALKADEEGNIILRVYNPTGKDLADCISFDKRVHSVEEVKLDESALRQLEVKDNSIQIAVKPYAIMTFRVTFDK